MASISTHYEDMKGNAECQNWSSLRVRGHPRSPAVSPFDRVHMTSYSILIETMCLSCTIFELLSIDKTKVVISGERQKVTQKAVRWPCGVCGTGVGNNSVQCC